MFVAIVEIVKTVIKSGAVLSLRTCSPKFGPISIILVVAQDLVAWVCDVEAVGTAL